MSKPEITKNITVRKFIEEHDKAKDFLRIKGYPVQSRQFDRMMGVVKLTTALAVKNLNFEKFLEEFHEFELMEKEVNASIGINNNDENPHHIVGSLPCVVQLPLHKAFESYLAEHQINVDFQFQGASLGTTWQGNIDPASPAVIMISPGFEPLFNKDFLQKNGYDGNLHTPINNQYHQDLNKFADPTNRLYVISAIPMVMVVNHKVLGSRKAPRSWHELTTLDYSKCIAYPNEEEDLLKALLTYIYKLGGEKALIRFAKNTLNPLHPAQMIKSKRLEEQPAIMIMPYFFSKIAQEEKDFEAIWPEEGALSMPIFLAADKRMNEAEYKALQFFFTKEAGTTFAKQGFFPSSVEGVENELLGDLWWVGWDYILENDIISLMQQSGRIFEENCT